MGNSNSSSAASAISTPKTPSKTSTNGSANNSMRRRSTTKSTKLSGKPPPPKLAIKTSLSNQPSLNVDTSALTNGNISPNNLSDDVNFNNIRSSKSMFELHNKSPTSPNALPLISQHNGSLRRSPTSNSTNAPLNGMCEGVENDATYHLLSSRFSQPSMAAPSAISRTRSIRRSDPSHPLLPSAREICRSCFENPHNDFGNRVLSRVYEKRPDFQKFVTAMGELKKIWPILSVTFQNFVEEIINNIENVDLIQKLCRQYGEEHIAFKCYGFKPDFWVSVADAILVETAILDMANHQPTEVVTAWSCLVTFMFSSIRDGYYSGLRLQRMSTRKKSLRRQESISTVDSSDNSYRKISINTATPDLFESNGNSMNSSFTDSMHRLSPNSTTRFSFQKSDSQNSCNGKIERPIFE